MKRAKENVFFVSVALLLFCFCSGNVFAGGGSQAPKTEEGGTTTVLVSWESVTDEMVALWQNFFIKPYEDAHPGVKIKYEPIPDITTVIKVQLAAGTGPDAFSADNVDIIEYWRTNMIQPWDNYIQRGYFSNLFSWAKDACKVDGRQAAIPMSYEGTMLWYNNDMMKANGWKFPSTRKEFEDICKAAAAKGIIPIAHGCNNSKGRNAYMHIMGDYLNSYTGPAVIKEWMTGAIKASDPRVKGAFQIFIDDWEAGWITQKETVTLDSNAALALWYQQMALFQVQGSWFTYNINSVDIDFDYSMGLYPSLTDGVPAAMPIGIGEVVMLNKAGKNVDIAADFFNNLYSDEANLLKAISGGQQILSRPIDTAKLDSSVNPKVVELYKFMSDVSAQGKIGYTIWTFIPGPVAYSLYSDIEAVLLKQNSLDNYLENLQSLLDKELSSGWKFSL